MGIIFSAGKLFGFIVIRIVNGWYGLMWTKWMLVVSRKISDEIGVVDKDRVVNL